MEYEMCEQGIENLVTGIVTQAAKDYRKVACVFIAYKRFDTFLDVQGACKQL